MKTKAAALSIIFSGVLLFSEASAQIKPILKTNKSDGQAEESYFKAGLSYLSNSVYNGRKDSLPVPYITPSFGYYHKSGVYLKSNVSFLVSQYAQRIDLVSFEGGYNFSAGDNFSGSTSAEKDFYNSNSVSVKSEIQGSLNASFTYNIADVASLTAGGSYIFTTGSPDLLFNPAISHEFDWGADDEWSLTPELLCNLSTQNYFDKYKQKRELKTGNKKRNSDSTVVTTPGSTIATTITVATENPKKFALLDYEASLYLTYDAKKWGAFFTPTFAMPQHPATYITTTKTKTVFTTGIVKTEKSQALSTEVISNIFFVEVGVYIKF